MKTPNQMSGRCADIRVSLLDGSATAMCLPNKVRHSGILCLKPDVNRYLVLKAAKRWKQ